MKFLASLITFVVVANMVMGETPYSLSKLSPEFLGKSRRSPEIDSRAFLEECGWVDGKGRFLFEFSGIPQLFDENTFRSAICVCEQAVEADNKAWATAVIRDLQETLENDNPFLGGDEKIRELSNLAKPCAQYVYDEKITAVESGLYRLNVRLTPWPELKIPLQRRLEWCIFNYNTGRDGSSDLTGAIEWLQEETIKWPNSADDLNTSFIKASRNCANFVYSPNHQYRPELAVFLTNEEFLAAQERNDELMQRSIHAAQLRREEEQARKENTETVADRTYRACAMLLQRDDVSALTNEVCLESFLTRGLPD